MRVLDIPEHMSIEADRYYLIRKIIGDKFPIPVGWGVLVQIFMDGEKHLLSNGNESHWDRSDDTKDGDAYRRGAGRILLIGDAAFKGDRFADWQLIPKIGDWVNFGRGDGVFRQYNGVQTLLIKDYSILAITPDPSIEGYHVNIGA